MQIKPLNNIVLAKLLEKEPEQVKSGIILPGDEKQGRFIRLEVLDIGEEVKIILKGDKVIANNLFEVIDPREKDIGFINSKDILGIIKND